jgi:EAL domain-containing protein (putative c-di-GMP-specific phosphodiesterase class I)
MLGTRAVLPDCRPLLADPDDLTLVFQPIVDLATATVAGYAALARFPGTSGPDAWFAAAAEIGLAAELEALAVHKALAAVPDLPDEAFLTVALSPHLLGTGPVQQALGTRPDLRRVVLQLTGHTPVGDLDTLRVSIDRLRSRGALIAFDGAGSAGLQSLAVLRPQVVALDRALVGEFAGRIDARLLSGGLETAAELAAVLRLGVPLGQGWVLGRPSPSFEPLAPEVIRLVQAHSARVRITESVAGLLRPIRQYEDGDAVVPPPAVLVGPLGEPLVLLLRDPRTGEVYRAPVSLRVDPSADVSDTLGRALTRPPAQRFDPVLCTDRTGAVLGLLRIEDLAGARREAARQGDPS